MNEQINIRLPQKLLKDARQKAKSEGFGTVQSYIEQTVRDDIYDDYVLSPKENELIDRIMKSRDDPRMWLNEEQFRRKVAELREKKRKKNARLQK